MTKARSSGKFDEIVDLFRVEKFIDTPVKRSILERDVRTPGVFRRRPPEPEILIVDEVLAVGDAGFRQKCLGKMQNVNRAGRTVLFVSHDIGQHRCHFAIEE